MAPVSFFRRHGIVRASQWMAPGDHPAVLQGVHTAGGLVDIQKVAPYSRRHVERGDWVVTEGDGLVSVVSDAEFQRNYQGV